MEYQGVKKRNQTDEIQGLAEFSVRLGIPVSKLPLQRNSDVGIENAIRSAVQEKLLAMADFGVDDVVDTGDDGEHSPEKARLSAFRTRFESHPEYHPGIEWSDVEKSLSADPESMRKMEGLDAKGHEMNVFGEEDGSFVFVSGWNHFNNVSADHRDICFDSEGQKLAEGRGYHPTGNAVDIAKSMEVDLADRKYNSHFEGKMSGWAWYLTDAETRKSGVAFCGDNCGVRKVSARDCYDSGSFRAALRVKRVS